MAQIIKTNGEVIETQPKNGTDFSLEEMQAIVEHKVNGVSYHYIEIINLRDGRIMVINDEGKLVGCDINHKATDIFQSVFHTLDFVVGNVLLCNDSEVR